MNSSSEVSEFSSEIESFETIYDRKLSIARLLGNSKMRRLDEAR